MWNFIYDLAKAVIPIVQEGDKRRISKESALGLFTALFGILGAAGVIDPLAGPEAAAGVVEAVWGAASNLTNLVAIIAGLGIQFKRATPQSGEKGIAGLFS